MRIMASSFPYVPAVLPLSFYDIHESCPAIFSTRLQTLPKRALVEPFPCPIIRSNIQLDIDEKVQQLRDQFPDHARYVQPVRNWLDLHHYFDAVDLYLDGPDFCYQVLSRLAVQKIEDEYRVNADIDRYAANWVESNKHEVASLNPAQDVLSLFVGERASMSHPFSHLYRLSLDVLTAIWAIQVVCLSVFTIIDHIAPVTCLTFFPGDLLDMRPEEKLRFNYTLDRYRRNLLQRMAANVRVLVQSNLLRTAQALQGVQLYRPVPQQLPGLAEQQYHGGHPSHSIMVPSSLVEHPNPVACECHFPSTLGKQYRELALLRHKHCCRITLHKQHVSLQNSFY